MYAHSMWFDIEHAAGALGWRPRWSNDEMFAQSYDWFVANRAMATNGAATRLSAPPGAHRRVLLSVLKRLS